MQHESASTSSEKMLLVDLEQTVVVYQLGGSPQLAEIVLIQLQRGA